MSASSLIAPGDELVSRVSLHRQRHWLFHGHVAPFAVFYAAWAYVWAFVLDYSELPEACAISAAVLGLLQVLVVLSCHWSVHVLVASTCSKVKTPDEATVAKVVPTPNNGFSEVVKLRKEEEDGKEVYFLFQKLKFTFDRDKKQFRGVSFPTDRSYRYYMDCKGHEDETELAKVQKHFGDNK